MLSMKNIYSLKEAPHESTTHKVAKVVHATYSYPTLNSMLLYESSFSSINIFGTSGFMIVRLLVISLMCPIYNKWHKIFDACMKLDKYCGYDDDPCIYTKQRF